MLARLASRLGEPMQPQLQLQFQNHACENSPCSLPIFGWFVRIKMAETIKEGCHKEKEDWTGAQPYGAQDKVIYEGV